MPLGQPARWSSSQRDWELPSFTRRFLTPGDFLQPMSCFAGELPAAMGPLAEKLESL